MERPGDVPDPPGPAQEPAEDRAKQSLKIEQILGLLPHRYPFLLIDRVLEVSDDKVVALRRRTSCCSWRSTP